MRQLAVVRSLERDINHPVYNFTMKPSNLPSNLLTRVMFYAFRNKSRELSPPGRIESTQQAGHHAGNHAGHAPIRHVAVLIQ